MLGVEPGKARTLKGDANPRPGERVIVVYTDATDTEVQARIAITAKTEDD